MLDQHRITEREYALAFLRSRSGSVDISVDDTILGEVFQALCNEATPPGKSQTWVDELIKDLTPVEHTVPTLNLCLSHDVDYVTSRSQHLKFIRRLGRAFRADGSRTHAMLTAMGSIYRLLTEFPPKERYGDFVNWLRLEESFGFRSTFFFLPYPDTHSHTCDGDYKFTDQVWYDGRFVQVADMMREIASAGWEVGLHGTFNSASQDGLLKRQKDSVEKIIGREVVSIRQHYLNCIPGLTHRLQAEAGFRIDSTRGFTRSIGVKSGTSHPFQLWDSQAKQPLPLIEVPLTAMDTSLVAMGLHKTGPIGPIEHLKQIGNEIASSGGLFCLNWHPHYLLVPQIQEVYFEILSWARARSALAHRMDSFVMQ